MESKKRRHRARSRDPCLSKKNKELNFVKLRSGKKILSQYADYFDFGMMEDKQNSSSSVAIVDHKSIKRFSRNGHETSSDNKVSHKTFVTDDPECFNKSTLPFNFDNDGKLSSAIKAKLRAQMSSQVNGNCSRSCDIYSSDSLDCSDGSVSTLIDNSSPIVIDGNKSNLNYHPCIFNGSEKELKTDFPWKHNSIESIVELFSGGNKFVKGQAEVVEWGNEPAVCGNSTLDGFNNICNNVEECNQRLNLYRDSADPPPSKKCKIAKNWQQNEIENDFCKNHQDMNASMESVENTDINSNSVFVGLDFCIVILRYPKRIFFYGKVKVSCLYGNIEVLGHRLNEDYQDVYSARSGAAMCFESFPSDDSVYGLFGKLRSLGVPIIKTEEIVTKMRPNDGIIILKSLENIMTKFIQKHFGSFDPFSMKRLPANPDFFEVEKKLKCSLFLEPPKQSFKRNSKWEEITNNIQERNVAVIAGGKSAGKSTFLRYYVNKTLAMHRSIAVIDLDPGQPEFSIATAVSVTVVHKPLIGANFTHLQNPVRMYTIGTINVMENLERYILATKELFDHCKRDSVISVMPWIINTMGMSDETGLQLITYIITLFAPNVVVQLENKNNYSVLLHSENIYRLWRDYCTSPYFVNIHPNGENQNYEYYNMAREDRQQIDSIISVPKRERFLNILAYFSQMVSSNSNSLMDAIPLIAPMHRLSIVTTSVIPEKNICSVINGKIVALCSSTEWSESKVSVLNKSSAVCYGYGIVRGFDLESKLVYIITPIKKHSLRNVNTLILLELLPDLCSLNKTSFDLGVKLPYSSQLSSGVEQQRLLKTPQRRFNLVQLLKMKSGNSTT